MSEERARTVATWLKSAGAALVVTASVFATTALDGGFGPSAEAKKGIYALAGGVAGIGWILTATGLSWHPEAQLLWRSVAVWALVGLVAAAATTAFWYRSGELAVPGAVSALYAVGWVLLAGAVAVTRKGGAVEIDRRNLVLGMGAAVSMAAGTLLLNPWERAACLTEGPGQVAVVAGWIMLVATR